MTAIYDKILGKVREQNGLSTSPQILTPAQQEQALANLNNTAADNTTGKLGYKVLQGNQSFASQVTAENTIYEIRDVFDLNNGRVTIPSNSTLKFDGGVIKNAVVTLQGNTVYNGNFIGCTFAGTLKGDCVVTEFGADNSGVNDNTNLLNNLLTITNRLTFPNGTYKITDTIVLNSPYKGIFLKDRAKILKNSSNANNRPAVHLYNQRCYVVGESRANCTIVSSDDSPNGVLSIGFKDPTDTTVVNVLNCSVRDIHIAGKAEGGNSSGEKVVGIYICNPFTSSSAASYFHTLNNIFIEKANIGIHLIGDANANQIDNILFWNVGNQKYLSGAAIVCEEITYNGNSRYPVENSISSIFHHGSTNAVTLRIIGKLTYNYFNDIISEQGGSTAQWLYAQNSEAGSNYFSGVDNVNGGSSYDDTFVTNNIIVKRGYIRTKAVSYTNSHNNNFYTGVFIQLLEEGKNYKVLFIPQTTDRTAKFIIRIHCTSYKGNALVNTLFKDYVAEFECVRIDSSYSCTCIRATNTISKPTFNSSGFTFYEKVPLYYGTNIQPVYRYSYEIYGNIKNINTSNIDTTSEVVTNADNFVVGGATQPIKSMTTSARNNNAYEWIKGEMIFDETLGQPIWWNGSGWVDATGTVV